MAIDLVKGQTIEIDLIKISVGIGWTPIDGQGFTFDWDASAIMIDGKRTIPENNFFIFYGNLDSPDGALHHTLDELIGINCANADDQTILVDLSKIDNRINEIQFVLTIHDAVARKQNFGQVRDIYNSYIRIVDDSNNVEIAKYVNVEYFSIETGLELGRLYKKDGKWKFEASGIGYKEDLSFFLSKYFKGQIIK
jgi:tellurium resistance protein TerD